LGSHAIAAAPPSPDEFCGSAREIPLTAGKSEGFAWLQSSRLDGGCRWCGQVRLSRRTAEGGCPHMGVVIILVAGGAGFLEFVVDAWLRL